MFDSLKEQRDHQRACTIVNEATNDKNKTQAYEEACLYS